MRWWDRSRAAAAIAAGVLLAIGCLSTTAVAAESITVASTTSTEQSGLFGWLLPRFTQATGIGVPSFLIYAHELLDFYGARTLIRTGTCGGLTAGVDGWCGAGGADRGRGRLLPGQTWQ